MLLTKDELFNLRKALAMSLRFIEDCDRQDEETLKEIKEIEQLRDLFHFVKNAEVELYPGDGDDGSNVKRINEILDKRRQKKEEKEAENVIVFPGRI
ncbi:MAG: hypothetical protein A4E52_00341 [Pelotomaculum sp. PtaB.Bin013]|uniref:Uncharacterized protein n=1 Tax=Pelotomaculum isophthalicicum JI TaxID=947010 RepID=A0A9X4H1M6_9FIRM|nr:hypothetical protein [Pelotomaculum isophthalicicum]MDF9408205.1 hypothetical protein [Pelotomaculum isophthalicicum JI]OPX91815.1 MAG: hypothetical protein A4E52_00341 [Pelotomaculum sp. PtaB.Bin013]